MMNSNPWNVGSIDEFSYLNCPECTFHSKEKTSFENHATRNHPLSSVLFGTATKVIAFSSRNELNQLKQLTSDQKCKDIVSKYNLPDNIHVQSMKNGDKSKKNFNGNTKVEKGHSLQKVSRETKYKSHVHKKCVSPKKLIGKHFASSLKEKKTKNLKKSFPSSSTISYEDQKFERAKPIQNFEIKTNNGIDFTSQIQPVKKEINNANLEMECNKKDTPKSNISTRNKDKFAGNFVEYKAHVNEIDPLAIEDQEYEGKQSYGCDICKSYFLMKSDLMDHIDSVHNENISNDDNYNSGIVHVKFSTKSPDAVKLQKNIGNKDLMEPEDDEATGTH